MFLKIDYQQPPLLSKGSTKKQTVQPFHRTARPTRFLHVQLSSSKSHSHRDGGEFHFVRLTESSGEKRG